MLSNSLLQQYDQVFLNFKLHWYKVFIKLCLNLHEEYLKEIVGIIESHVVQNLKTFIYFFQLHILVLMG